MRVFVSYSREHFYLAEDLALALRQHGVDAWFDVHCLEPGDEWQEGVRAGLREAEQVVLVASPQATMSAHVQEELALARDRELPVVVARAGPVDLPDWLAAAPRIDMRRRFEHRVRDVVDALNGKPVPPARGGPPAVVFAAVVCLLEAGVVSAWFAGSFLLETQTTPGQAFASMVYAFAALGCGWLAWETARQHRRRLLPVLTGLALTALGGVFLALLTLLWAAANDRDGEALDIALGLTLAGSLIAPVIWVLLSPAFYRHMSTGDAPHWVRGRMLRRRGVAAAAPPRHAPAPVTYALHCHQVDAGVRGELDRELRRFGHGAAATPDAQRQICVVSNLTPTRWWHETLSSVGGRVVIVIAAPVPEDVLRNVNRYQWVDHRRRRRKTLSKLAASLGGSASGLSRELVPESLSSPVVPIGVLTLAVVNAIGAITWMGHAATRLAGGDLLGGEFGESPPLLASFSLLFVATTLAAATTATLLTRRVSFKGFVALFLATTVAMTALGRHQLPELDFWTLSSWFVQGFLLMTICGRSIARWLPKRAPRGNVERVGAGGLRWYRRRGTRRLAVATVAACCISLGGAALATPPVTERAGRGDTYALRVPPGWQDITTETRDEGLGEELDIVLWRGDRYAYVLLATAEGSLDRALAGHVASIQAQGAALTAEPLPATLDREPAVRLRFRRITDGRLWSIDQLVTVRHGVRYLVWVAVPDGPDPDPADLDSIMAAWKWVAL